MEIQGEAQEVDSRIPGSVMLVWTLTSVPTAQEVELFDNSNLTYDVATLDFMSIDPPKIDGQSIRWTVPAHHKQHARGYIDQRITSANS